MESTEHKSLDQGECRRRFSILNNIQKFLLLDQEVEEFLLKDNKMSQSDSEMGSKHGDDTNQKCGTCGMLGK